MEDHMDNKQTSGATAFPVSSHSETRPLQPQDGAKDLTETASDAISKLADAAQSAGQQAKATATSLASEANEKAKGVMNEQVAVGADWIGYVAKATKAAADDLKHNAPQLSGLVRDAADKVEKFSKNLQHQSVEDLYRSASDFTRRQPAVVFGSAALFGFFMSRLLKANPGRVSEGVGGGVQGDAYRSGSSHGT
jgi:hypothetical protein